MVWGGGGPWNLNVDAEIMYLMNAFPPSVGNKRKCNQKHRDGDGIGKKLSSSA